MTEMLLKEDVKSRHPSIVNDKNALQLQYINFSSCAARFISLTPTSDSIIVQRKDKAAKGEAWAPAFSS